MMIDVLAETFSFAVGIAISPIPISAVIVMLFTPRAKSNGPAFLVGWVVGLLLVGSVVLLVPGVEQSGGEPSTTSGVVKGLVGLLLLAAGWKLWTKRPGSGETADTPKWMDALDGFGVGKSFGMGFLLLAANPKNLLLVVAATVTIADAGLSTGEQATALVLFTLIAASSVAVPVIGYLIVGERADASFVAAKDWLIQNNSVVMAVLLLIFGVNLLGDAVQILF